MLKSSKMFYFNYLIYIEGYPEQGRHSLGGRRN